MEHLMGVPPILSRELSPFVHADRDYAVTLYDPVSYYCRGVTAATPAFCGLSGIRRGFRAMWPSEIELFDQILETDDLGPWTLPVVPPPRFPHINTQCSFHQTSHVSQAGPLCVLKHERRKAKIQHHAPRLQSVEKVPNRGQV